MRWGVEGGVNVSHAFDTEKTKAGFNIGAVGEYSFSSHWFMDASLKLSSQPCGIDVRGSSDDQKFWLKADYTISPCPCVPDSNSILPTVCGCTSL